MRVALLRTVLALSLLVLASASAAAASINGNPTPKQISRAISRAERSSALWATVNVCDTRRYPHTIGIRGQMPGLGFPSWMSMQVQIYYFDKSQHRFMPDPQAMKLIRLGRSSSLLQQAGATFQFAPHTGYLEAKINFVWRRSGKLLGQTLRRTTAGHRSADFGDPKHYSARQCKIR